MPLVLNGATSGSTTLTPTDAVTTTLTLPSTSGTLAVSGGSPSFTTITTTSDASISGLTVGLGGGSIITNNVVGGASPLGSNTTGAYNSAFGRGSLQANTTGSNNTAVGYAALIQNTTASNNTAVGYQAGYSGTTANDNVFVGKQAGYSVTSAAANTCVGAATGYSLTTGYRNTFVGVSNQVTGAAGGLITTGNNNTIIGGYTGNQGGLDIRTASNYIVLSDGDGNPRMSIDGSGNASFGLPNQSGAQPYFYVLASNGAVPTTGTDGVIFSNGRSGAAIKTYASASSWTHLSFNYNGSQVGSISSSGSTTAYNTSSDYRLKENVQPMIGALDTVAQLKPVTYDWISDKSKGQGFIAHELQAIVPDCVTGEKDAVDENGKPLYQGIDTSFLVATLTAAIQELNAKLEAQALEIATLKAK